MIKVNLLPVKRKKKPKPVPTFVMVGALFLTISLVISFYVFYSLKSKITTLEEQKAANAKKLAALQERIKEVKDFERLNKKFMQRKEIIEKLAKNQSMPAKILDEMSKRLSEGVWLRSMIITGENMSISGVGFSNFDIVNYVQNLKGSELFEEVILRETRQTQEQGIDVYSFKITLKIRI
jgi:type IV pilus assembly protein PilN